MKINEGLKRKLLIGGLGVLGIALLIGLFFIVSSFLSKNKEETTNENPVAYDLMTYNPEKRFLKVNDKKLKLGKSEKVISKRGNVYVYDEGTKTLSLINENLEKSELGVIDDEPVLADRNQDKIVVKTKQNTIFSFGFSSSNNIAEKLKGVAVKDFAIDKDDVFYIEEDKGKTVLSSTNSSTLQRIPNLSSISILGDKVLVSSGYGMKGNQTIAILNKSLRGLDLLSFKADELELVSNNADRACFKDGKNLQIFDIRTNKMISLNNVGDMENNAISLDQNLVYTIKDDKLYIRDLKTAEIKETRDVEAGSVIIQVR